MYTLAVRRRFISRHALVGGDWGRENLPNSHRYLLELQLSNPELDEHGFVVDIVEVERQLDGVVDYFRERLLNDLQEFSGLNPSLEHFARILCRMLRERIPTSSASELSVVLWEDDEAWVSYADA